MTVLLAPPPPYLMLTLDTAGPVLSVTAPGVVQPPDVLLVTATSNESLAEVQATFTDALGQATALGVEVHGLSVVLQMPTVGLGSGRGVLQILARDQACNTSSVQVPVLLDRPRAFDVLAETIPEFMMTTDINAALALSTDVGHFADVVARHDDAMELSAEPTHLFVLTTETTNG